MDQHPGRRRVPRGDVHWLTFSDLRQSVVDDVVRIREHPLTPKDVPVHGFIYDVKTGRLLPVES